MPKEQKKIAVVLFNLGGPDKFESIKSFLFNFFMDKNIIRLPLIFRYFLAKFISIRRSKNEAGSSYSALGGKSPLLENSWAQAQALEKLLNEKEEQEFKVFVSMRYWHPMAEEISTQVKNWQTDEIILLPLYPQYSTTTTKSSFESWGKACAKINLNKPTVRIDSYFLNKGFISASVKNIKAVYEEALKETKALPRLLFSAHGLPEKIIKAGDPYQLQCEESAKQITRELGIKNLDWEICYQSRVGRLKWIGPSTEEALQKAAKDKVGVIIYPHAFTQEHVETLVEIEIEYRALAKELGVPAFYRVPTVGTHPDFIDGLAQLVQKVEI